MLVKPTSILSLHESLSNSFDGIVTGVLGTIAAVLEAMSASRECIAPFGRGNTWGDYKYGCDSTRNLFRDLLLGFRAV